MALERMGEAVSTTVGKRSTIQLNLTVPAGFCGLFCSALGLGSCDEVTAFCQLAKLRVKEGTARYVLLGSLDRYKLPTGSPC